MDDYGTKDMWKSYSAVGNGMSQLRTIMVSSSNSADRLDEDPSELGYNEYLRHIVDSDRLGRPNQDRGLKKKGRRLRFEKLSFQVDIVGCVVLIFRSQTKRKSTRQIELIKVPTTGTLGRGLN